MTRITKKSVYAAHGIEFRRVNGREQIYSPLGWCPPVLVNGNRKIGRGVYHWSMLPGTAIFHVVINGQSFDVRGTCDLICDHCYAMTGHYNQASTIESLARKTIFARDFLAWLERAIRAQIEADKIKYLRIHVAGDFFSTAYSDMWTRIVSDYSDVVFWTYTKADAAPDFSEFRNANIVDSFLPSGSLNFGTCAEILAAWEWMNAAGIPCYICRCGIDPDQHCSNCKGCSVNKYVLFLKHGDAGYKAADDPLFPVIRAIVEAQDPIIATTAATAA